MLQNIDLVVTCVCCDSQVKWHEICLSIPAAILEVLNAWENGVLSVEAVQVRPKHKLLPLFCLLSVAGNLVRLSASLSCDTRTVSWHWPTPDCVRIFSLAPLCLDSLTSSVENDGRRAFAIAAMPQFPFDGPTSLFSCFIQSIFSFYLIFSCNTCNETHLVTNLAYVFYSPQTAFVDHILPFSRCCHSLLECRRSLITSRGRCAAWPSVLWLGWWPTSACWEGMRERSPRR